MALHLVRHGRPLVDANVPASDWNLDPDEVGAVRDLADSGVLPKRARWISSDEPKAVQTAHLLAGGTEVETVHGLREQYRPAGWVQAYAVRVHRSLVRPGEPAEDGWETAQSTRSRVVDAVHALLEHTSGDLVVVGHGTAWTLAVSELTGTPVDLVAWERMLMPDHCAIEGRRLVQAWGDWRVR